MAVVDHVGRSEPEAGTESESGRPLVLDEATALTPLGHGWDAEPVVLDWTGRGVADLLVSSGGGPRGRVARIYRALDPTDGIPRRYADGDEVDGLEGLRLFCPIPSERETRFDLVALAPEGLILLRNEGAPDAPRFPSQEVLGLPADLGVGPGRVAQMMADDWDGDGLVDLIVGYDDLSDYWPDGRTVPPEQQIGFNQVAGHPGYDGRGAWRGRAPRGRLLWLRNVGRPGAPRFEPPQPIDAEADRQDLPPRLAPLAVSWGGGRAWEFLLADASGILRLHRNFGGQRPPVLMEPRPIRFEGQPLILPPDRGPIGAADLDGDGRVELVFGRADGRVFAVHAGRARDEATTPTPLLQEGRTLRFGGHAVVAAGDLDADGDMDLIAGDASGRLLLAEDIGSAGDHRYAIPIELEAGGLPFRVEPGPDGVLGGPVDPPSGYSCPALVDWKTNGRLDLIVGGAGGDVLFLRNNGSSTTPRFDRPEPLRIGGHPLITPPRVRPAAASWSGNDLPDLIALDLQGILCVFPRVGPTEVGVPVPVVDRLGRFIRLDGAFGQGGRCALWAGPWTGSGRIDLLIGLPRGARHVIPAVTGRPLDRIEDLPTVLLLENIGHGAVIPRPVHRADGRPLIVGSQGCSPCGVSWMGSGDLDLLVGSDAGDVYFFRRDDLRWS